MDSEGDSVQPREIRWRSLMSRFLLVTAFLTGFHLLYVKTGQSIPALDGLYPTRDPVSWPDVPWEFVASLPALLALVLGLGMMLFAFEAYPAILQRRESARRARRVRPR